MLQDWHIIHTNIKAKYPSFEDDALYSVYSKGSHLFGGTLKPLLGSMDITFPTTTRTAIESNTPEDTTR